MMIVDFTANMLCESIIENTFSTLYGETALLSSAVRSGSCLSRHEEKKNSSGEIYGEARQRQHHAMSYSDENVNLDSWQCNNNTLRCGDH